MGSLESQNEHWLLFYPWAGSCANGSVTKPWLTWFLDPFASRYAGPVFLNEGHREFGDHIQELNLPQVPHHPRLGAVVPRVPSGFKIPWV